MQGSIFKNPLDEEEYKERIEPRKEDIRGPFFRDQTAIIHSFPYRRLKHKAQVFFAPNNDHVCTRIEHSLHVAAIGQTIARGLKLNEEMTYAIGLGHDLGHGPFGHAGEKVLAEKCKDVGGFVHELHGLRVVDKLGNRGKSLNLTYGVRDGIVCHCGEQPEQEVEPRKDKRDLSTIKRRDGHPCSYEGCVARMSDRIAYLGRDLEDAIYGGFVKRREVPRRIEKELGETNGEIIDTLVLDVIATSKERGVIAISEEKFKVLMDLHNFSNDKIYKHEAILRYIDYCERIITELFDYLCGLHLKWGFDLGKYSKSRVQLDHRFKRYLGYMKRTYDKEKASAQIIVRDYVAGMTDSYALRCMKEISLPDELSFDIEGGTA